MQSLVMSHRVADFEDVWLRLRRHLERARGFTFCVIFSPSRLESRTLRERLEGALRWRTSLLETVDPLQGGGAQGEALSQLTTANDARIRMRAPVWLALDADPGAAQADGMRRALLAALNERRGTLEHVFARPLILSLPVDYNQEVWTYAPDLWTVRGFVGELPPAPAAVAPPEVGQKSVFISHSPAADAESAPAIREWRRVAARAVTDPESVSPAAAWSAFEDPFRQGALRLAHDFAMEGLSLARARRIADTSHAAKWERERDLSVSLDNVGQAAQAQGEWSQAEQAYRESLEIRRELAARLGTPEAQRDLSVSLHNVGRVAQAQGEWSQAEQAYRESLEIRRELATRLGTPQAQRDLSVSLDNVGRVAQAQSEWSQAEPAYRESLESRRELAARLGTPQAQRDLSVSLNNVGRVAQAQSEWSQAEQAYRESLEIARELAARLGTPEAQRDLSVSLNNVGRVANAQGEWGQAETALGESAEIGKMLVERFGAPPAALDDLGVTLMLLGLAESKRGQFGSLEHAERIYSELAQAHPDDSELQEKLQTVRRSLRQRSTAQDAAQAIGGSELQG